MTPGAAPLRYLLVVNPVSGHGAGPRVAARLESGLAPRAAEVRVVTTTGPGHATEIARTTALDFDRLVVVGGDGTLNESVTGLLATELPADGLPELGFVPGGTGNAARRAFGMVARPAEWPRAMEAEASRPVDVGIADLGGGERRPFLLWLGAGIDAVVMNALHGARRGRMGPLGVMRRVPRVVRALSDYAMPEIEAVCNGGTAGAGGLSSALVANVDVTPWIGRVSSRADPHDGVLDLVGIEPRRTVTLLGLTVKMLAGRLEGSPGVVELQGRHIELRSDGVVPVQLDGEPVGRLPVTVSVRPGALRLLCGPSP